MHARKPVHRLPSFKQLPAVLAAARQHTANLPERFYCRFEDILAHAVSQQDWLDQSLHDSERRDAVHAARSLFRELKRARAALPGDDEDSVLITSMVGLAGDAAGNTRTRVDAAFAALKALDLRGLEENFNRIFGPRPRGRRPQRHIWQFAWNLAVVLDSEGVQLAKTSENAFHELLAIALGTEDGDFTQMTRAIIEAMRALCRQHAVREILPMTATDVQWPPPRSLRRCRHRRLPIEALFAPLD